MRRLFRWIKNLFIKPTKPTKVPVSDYIDSTTPFEFEKQTMYPPLTVNAVVRGGTVDQREFFRSAMSIMRHVINSSAFQDAVLDFDQYTYTDKNSRQIYMEFMSGVDLYEPAIVADRELDADVTIYRSWKNTVGYTYPNTRRQWINWKYVTMNKVSGIASIIGNVVHEYCHNIGYKHPSRRTNDRKNSVPYAYGRVAKQIATQMMTNNNDFGDIDFDN